MTAPRSYWAGLLRLAAVVALVARFTVPLTGPVGLPRAAADEPRSTPFIRVRVDQVTPHVVTTTSQPVVTVSGMVTNIGDRPVRDVMVRLEHAAAVDTSAGLRTSLDGATDQYHPAADFLTIAPELRRGQEAGFALSAPLRSLTKPSLGINQPGIYPLLVNVNGTPDHGDPARLDNARFLLPVIGVPPDRADSLESAVAPDTSKPVWVTMLWPLADRPRLAPGQPGGTVPVRLVDDDLATSLATGGRLDVLLSAAEVATSHDVDPDGAVGRALCLAVDPDLLVTVNAMTAGYVVSNPPGGPAQQPGAPTHPGAGQAAATGWLNRLRALAHHVCVTPLPYAQADLDALQRINDRRLTVIATTSVGNIVDQILDVASTRGAMLLTDGPLTVGAVGLLNANNSTVAVAAAHLAAPDSKSSADGFHDVDTTLRRLSQQVVLAPFDPAVSAALAGAGNDPSVPTYLDPSLTVRLTHDSTTARRQDALGSMFWHALDRDAPPRTQLLVPPATWNLQADDAQVILTALATIIRSGLGVPHPLAAVIAEAAACTEPGAPPDVSAPGRGRFAETVTADINGQTGRLWRLTSALSTDERTGLTGVQYTAPMREDMLRALSQSQPPDGRNELAKQRLAVVGDTVNDLFGAVTIVNPGGSYTLATEHSPLPLALHNGLAVPIKVRLQVDAPPGITVTDIGQIELPPGYLPLRVPIEVNFTQRVSINVTLRTPDGTRLGEPVRLSVHSNAYGKVLFAITLTAAAVLFFLAGRRLWHRFRDQPDRADPPHHQPADRSGVGTRVDEEHRV
ncbi:DUF6049 family protein [Mycobacterium tilburgii]|uniref:DUF6049 family protein n=1 Tax=Mycobacterium tilburgii TaxID=44467 RepID=UPI001183B3DF|nr:DUF6049 family protein [Mycobacterium tilburgii]